MLGLTLVFLLVNSFESLKNTKVKPNIKNASIDEDDINIDNVLDEIGYGPSKPQVKTNPKDN
jgi:hypothetical protein